MLSVSEVPLRLRLTCELMATSSSKVTKTSEILKFPIVCARSICYRSELNDVESILIITFASNKAPRGQALCGSLRKSQND